MPTHLHEHLALGQQDRQHQAGSKQLSSTSSKPSSSNGTQKLDQRIRALISEQSLEDEEERSDLSLDRRLSAPARIKSINCNQNNLKDGQLVSTAEKDIGFLNKHSLIRSHTIGSKHRVVGNKRLTRTDGCRHYCHKHHHKSASPLSSSSSASDSAFSQSRSTLEGSESGSQSTNCFTSGPLLVDSGEPCHRFSMREGSGDKITEHTNDVKSIKQQHQLMCQPIPLVRQDQSEHFQLIWKHLSYKVPEKRFTRFKTKLYQHLRRTNQLSSITLGFSRNQVVKSDHPIEDGTIPNDTHHNQDNPSATSSSRQRQFIFSNLNGCIKSGQLTAILGPSGAGKTTFLKCLTNSIVNGVSGIIDINGGSNTSHHLKLCIIPQKDYLFDNLTVMENLLFASRIKNTKTKLDHKGNVNRVASLLGLQACLTLKTSKLSGGQYKRVSIAQELLSQPDILILDEPTSGLDSLTCFKTVSVLRDLVNLSQSGLMPPLAIVMTIHQPQIKIFNQFHHVYVLSSMGQCVYEGQPEYLVDTVANCCKLLPPPDDQNAASFIIDLGSEAYGLEPIEQLVKLQRENFLLIHSSVEFAIDNTVRNNNEKYCNNGCNNNIGNGLIKSANLKQTQMLTWGDIDTDQLRKSKLYYDDSNHNTTDGDLRISERLMKRNNHDDSFWLHTGLLIRRLWISMWRDSLLATTRISFHLIIPFVFYFVYSQKSGSANACPHVEREMDIREMVSDSNIQRLTTQHDELILTFENVSLFFLLLYSFSMCVLAVTALSFPLNMRILLKETSNGWYTMPRFVMAKMLADLPMELAMPMISVSIAYAITGQPSSHLSWRMLTVTAVMTLCSLISQTQGLLFGAYFMNNVQAAVFISQASTLPWVLLSGFTTRVSELPKILQWLSFGSIYRLGIESIVAVRYGFGTCPCNQGLVDDRPAKIVGIPDQLRSVMSYYMDMYTESPEIANSSTTTDTEIVANSTKPDLFEKIAATLSRANTYGVDITSCDDVRPFIMSAREVDETTLPTFFAILVSVLVGLKILLFYVVKIRAG